MSLKHLNLFILFGLISFTTLANKVSISIIANSSSPLESLVVYLTPAQPISNKENHDNLIIAQKNKKFVPYIEVVQKGNNISFHNNDDITHHIYSVSGKNRFDFKIQGRQVKNSPNLNNIGEVAMGCNIHDWMSGYVLVVDTPFFNKTNTQGTAIFNSIPDGKYQLTIWHPQLDAPHNKVSQTITITGNQQLQLKLTNSFLPIPSQESEDDFDFLEDY